MSELNAKLGAVVRPLEVANTLIQELIKILWADHIQIVLYNYEKEQYENLVTMNKESLPPWQDVTLAIRWLSFNTPGEIINNLPADKRFNELKLPIISMMAAPLNIHSRTIGGVFILSRQFHSYTSMDLKLLNILTAQAATALEAARLYELLMNSFVHTVFTLVETLEKRDPYTGGHTRRVMEYSVKIGEKMGFSKEELEQLRFAAVLHDIGKIGIRDEVLLKNTKLTDEEYEIIKKHTIYGEEILSKIRSLKHLIPGVKHHHERYDGNGYPDGQKAQAINLHARIIAVADAFDAMTSDRPYRKKMTIPEAREELLRNAGKQFDPEIVKIFCEILANELVSEVK